jgi:hypothetical protein
MPQPRYPSDLSDEERVILEPLLRAGPKSAAVLPSTHPAGRQRCVLPSEEHLLVVHVALRVPPWQGVYYNFRKRRLEARFGREHDRLWGTVRKTDRRDRDPSASVIDSQVVKPTRVGGREDGYDGA